MCVYVKSDFARETLSGTTGAELYIHTRSTVVSRQNIFNQKKKIYKSEINNLEVLVQCYLKKKEKIMLDSDLYKVRL